MLFGGDIYTVNTWKIEMEDSVDKPLLKWSLGDNTSTIIVLNITLEHGKTGIWELRVEVIKIGNC